MQQIASEKGSNVAFSFDLPWFNEDVIYLTLDSLESQRRVLVLFKFLYYHTLSFLFLKFFDLFP